MNNENNNFNQNTNNEQVNSIQQPAQQQNVQVQSANNVSIQTRKTNKNAIISLVCSTVSLFIFWWLAFVGIGLGIRALNEIKTTGEKGKTLVIISIILAVICAVLYFSQIVPR